MRATSFAVCLLCCLIACGCFRSRSGSHRHHHDHHQQTGRSTTSLSEASRRAADADAAQEPVRRRQPRRRHDHHHHGGSTVVVVGSGVAACPPTAGDEVAMVDNGTDTEWGKSLGLRLGYLDLGEDGLDNGIAYRLGLTTELSDRWSVEVGFGYIDLAFEAGDDAMAGLEDPYAIELGASAIRYLRPREATFSPFLGAGMAVTALQWDYVNVLVDEYGDPIEDDGVAGGALEAIIGLQVIGTPRLQCELSCRPRIWLFDGSTSAGFDNDLFETIGGVEFSGRLAYRF